MRKIKPLAIGIDKLRIGTDTLGRGCYAHARAACQDIVKSKRARALRSTTYKYRYQFRLGERATMLIQFRPVRSGKARIHPKFSFELNPNLLGKDQLAEAHAYLRQVLGHFWAPAMRAARVTLIDYFADYPVKVQDLLLEVARKESCGVWGVHYGDGWVPQTYYFGAGGTDGQFRIYDKAAQAIATGQAERFGSIETLKDKKGCSVGSRMRVEVRRLPSNVPLRAIHTLPNPFSALKIASIDSSAKEFASPEGQAVLQAARVVGWQVAVRSVGDANTLRRLRHAFCKYLVDWWSPDQAAVSAGVALLNTGLFPDEAFDTQVHLEAAGMAKQEVAKLAKDEASEKAAKKAKHDAYFADLED